MNSSHIREALSIPFFRNHFMGFLFIDSLKLSKKKHKYMDFYIVNTNHVFGEHWFACIHVKSAWIIFDCSAFTPEKNHEALEKILSKETRVIFDRRQLQNPTSLSCGLHSISYIYFMFRLFSKGDLSFEYTHNYYCDRLLEYCTRSHFTPDMFVYHLNALLQ